MSTDIQSRRMVPFPENYRASGLLLHLTPLPSTYGIGDVGPGAVKWIDKLSEAGQSWRRHCRGRGVRSVELDGQPLPNNTVPLSDDGKNHNVSVELG